ncbi:MAG: HAD-IA family hydrolase [Devosia nanyangense]|uniref:HAD-IA family hydrolase n=1 Tax=Devosia nanyangense TaxID=1228055 RepID=A0A933L044_9HYPH|nr:HAD-IA family hydrolase [Devosia nanyangense]
MRLVIFDLDGTLIDSVQLIVETVTASFKDVGDPPPDERTIRSISGITLDDAMKVLAPGADAARVAAIAEAYRKRYRATEGSREPLFAGALAALDRLQAEPETVLAVATGKGYRSAVTLLERHGIVGRFQSVQTPDHNRGKPDPQMIETAMEKAGANGAQTAMIGDTVHDMRMARAAGVKAIGVAWGYHEIAELHAEGADLVIERFDQLDGALDQLLGVADA